MSCTIGGRLLQTGDALPRELNNQHLIAHSFDVNTRITLIIGKSIQSLPGNETEFVRIYNAGKSSSKPNIKVTIPGVDLYDPLVQAIVLEIVIGWAEEWLFLNDDAGSGRVIATRVNPSLATPTPPEG